ncbi:MAG: DNA-binding protein [Cyanobacteria bacterium SZAS LIN-2]|nr:DNA-binding protein [Cyanobacteria bacterium SZAS LIN-3]MBS1997363.1 DNA-binding protein [Cyanobacteria bacterium SZAS LIN-2]
MKEQNCQTIVVRLKPGSDLEQSLAKTARDNNLRAGVIISLVGSLTVGTLRLAGAPDGTEIQGPLEIVSATGTLSATSMHVHISVSDGAGKTIGGHLLPGCLVYTTVELVIHDLSDQWTFERAPDAETGYDELVVTPTSP